MTLWPALDAEDRPTIVALHLFSQVIGKVPTALLPWRNHGWHLTLHVTPRGLVTEPIHTPGGAFTLGFDLADHLFVYESAAARISVRSGRCRLPSSMPPCWRSRRGRARHPPSRRTQRSRSRHPVRRGQGAAGLRSRQRRAPARRFAQRRPGLPPVPLILPRQGQPGPFLLGQLRSRRHPLLGPPGAAPSGRHPQPSRRGDPRGLQPRSLKRRLLARRRRRRGRAVLLFLRLSDPGGFR